MIKTWEEIKEMGQKHYKTGGVEQIDLFKADGSLHDWCINEIRAKAARNIKSRHTEFAKFIEDMDEIIHSAEMLKTMKADQEEERLDTLMRKYTKGER